MADICCSPSTSEFTCFPKLPREIQVQMSDMATYTQADSHPPRIHPIASDLDTRHPPSLDSDLRSVRGRSIPKSSSALPTGATHSPHCSPPVCNHVI
ncbi:uncharacterized protein K444DRAFT_309995 [Hyaloscypha bicolor E]|uniref:Uncharacterized protein n=1 Tax=Hyaloscypha bicolor E TaxID=1095630 RepID=A0A2J6TLT7_9HELO|nr:uncharacterized protein K444DRAFT_309995 [Hyaloscypha bicolor E]PMD63976.1 hypothetical protein K444DRAFT_309995 [Hyaloscypha bicolor E]